MTNSSNGEGIYKGLLEVLLRDTFTPIEWEGFTPYNELPPRQPLPVHNQISLDPKLLERVAGRYELSAGLALDDTRKEIIISISRMATPRWKCSRKASCDFSVRPATRCG